MSQKNSDERRNAFSLHSMQCSVYKIAVVGYHIGNKAFMNSHLNNNFLRFCDYYFQAAYTTRVKLSKNLSFKKEINENNIPSQNFSRFLQISSNKLKMFLFLFSNLENDFFMTRGQNMLKFLNVTVIALVLVFLTFFSL